MNQADPIADILAQLKPVEELPTINAWPPAIGWWILALMVIGLIFFITPRLYKRLKVRRARNNTLRRLTSIEQAYQEHQNARQTMNDVNALLKRVALHLYGREKVAGLTDSAWLNFLDSNLPEPCFTHQLSEEFTQLRYQSTGYQSTGDQILEKPRDLSHLFLLTKLWITRSYK